MAMEKSFSVNIGVRWADLDPNFHMLHSKYYDYGATCRMEFLVKHGLTPEWMMQHQVGPILFRETATFRREVRFGDDVQVFLELLWSRPDFSRWSFRHRLVKNGDVLAATMEVEGAWLNLATRKLAVPPAKVAETFNEIPLAEDFSWREEA